MTARSAQGGAAWGWTGVPLLAACLVLVMSTVAGATPRPGAGAGAGAVAVSARQSTGVATSRAGALAGPAAGQRPWGWPLAGPQRISRPFHAPATRYGTGHRGVDLPSTAGAVVRSAGPGRVSYAGLLAGRGVVVVVHGELRTTYEPVDAQVLVGQVVVLGQSLGRLADGHGGCPVAACLHWGLRRGQDYLDPVRLVQRGPVRLLPVPAGPAVR